jgi:hypothetical protein
LIWKKFVFENFNNFENNIISVELAKVLRYSWVMFLQWVKAEGGEIPKLWVYYTKGGLNIGLCVGVKKNYYGE